MTSSTNSDALPGRVPFFHCRMTIERVWPRICERIDRSMSLGCFVDGPLVRELEQAISIYTGASHAIAVGSGTDALLHVLAGVGIGRGDEVITSVYSFIASASTISLVGATPIFVDIDPTTYGVDPAQLTYNITASTRLILPVHLFTQTADMEAIGRIACERDLLVVEDSAEAIGMFGADRHAGCYGRAGVLSFYPTKTLGGVGDGGMVITDDAELATAIRQQAGEGGAARGPGRSAMDEVQAAVLLSKLEILDEQIVRRRVIAERYTSRLSGIPNVRSPEFPSSAAEQRAVYYVYLIESDRRDALQDYLATCGVETETYYETPLHLQPAFAYLGHRNGEFPVAEAASRRALALPLYADLLNDEVDYVCECIEQFYFLKRT